ncbi:MAG: UDP-2,3-diacylglucosamine diphosphatase LpxI [Planctomycetaceae bacterium]|jgi:DUF1009 family protein|nr:UDP-2,3-diacylglucosamine diphosphatase LpxI [Planctomycetaceae bacterium]
MVELLNDSLDLGLGRVGLIAGWGRYPVYLAEALKQRGAEVFCLGIANHADLVLRDICDDWLLLGLGKLQTAFRFFHKHKITYGTMAGKINKKLLLHPYFVWKQLPDFYTIRKFLPMFITQKKDLKDDTLLTAVVEAFAENNINLLPGTDLIPELLVKRQKLTRRGPNAAEWKDICFGWTIAKEMGRLDIGQSVCVRKQAILAVEAIEGTDECIRRAGSLSQAKGFTVIKVAKPQQDMRFDVPTFGLLTLKTMYESGARALAIEADKTIFIDRQDVVDFANLHNIVIVSILPEDSKKEKSPFAEFPSSEL